MFNLKASESGRVYIPLFSLILHEKRDGVRGKRSIVHLESFLRRINQLNGIVRINREIQDSNKKMFHKSLKNYVKSIDQFMEQFEPQFMEEFEDQRASNPLIRAT